MAKNVPDDKVFYLANNEVIKNLDELYMKVSKATDDVFKHHVSENKNDFINWIKDVVKDKDLIKKLQGINQKNKFVEIVKIHITKPVTVLKKKSKTGKKAVAKIVKKTKDDFNKLDYSIRLSLYSGVVGFCLGMVYHYLIMLVY